MKVYRGIARDEAGARRVDVFHDDDDGPAIPLKPRHDLGDHSWDGFEWGLPIHNGSDERHRHPTDAVSCLDLTQPVEVIISNRNVDDKQAHVESGCYARFLGYVGLEFDGGVNEHPLFSIRGGEVDKELVAIATEVRDLGEPERRQDDIPSQQFGASTEGPGVSNVETANFGASPHFPLEEKQPSLRGVVLIGTPPDIATLIAKCILPGTPFMLAINANDLVATGSADGRVFHRATLYVPPSDPQAQLALALCADLLEDDDAALDLYQEVKRVFVHSLDRDQSWIVSDLYLYALIERLEAEAA